MTEGKSKAPESKRARSVRKLLGSAGRLIERGRVRAAGLRDSSAKLQDQLIIEAQQATYREMHRRFTERAESGDVGLDSALDALDAMWFNIRELRSGANMIVGTLSTADGDVKSRLSQFYGESTGLLSDAIRRVFAHDLGNLAVPPERMAVLVRVMLEGLVVELAQAKTNEDVAIVDQAFADLRQLFERFVLIGDTEPQFEEIVLEPIPLPW